MLRQLKTGRKLATAFCLVTLAAIALAQTLRGGRLAEAAPASIASVSSLSAGLPHLPGGDEPRAHRLSWSRVREDGSGYVEVLHDGGRAELTLDPAMQHRAERLLGEYPAPYAAAVVISVDDGRVLALAGRSTVEPEKNAADLALTAWAPAASVFKLVTSAALLAAGVQPNERVCYHAGVHSLEADNLEDHPELDQRCKSFAYGLAKSQNAIVGRLAHDHLDADSLTRMARALGFGSAPSFALPVQPSLLEVPGGDDPLAFARVAAGFWNTTLSPLHGAMLAATLARGGVTPPVKLIERLFDGDGRPQPVPAAAPATRVLDEHIAHVVGRMMIGTTEWGSARGAFHEGNRRALGRVRVAGKTGSLNRAEPFTAYSWFVGFAPAEAPRVAFAVLLGRDEDNDVKAAQVARALVASWLTSTRGTSAVARR